MLGEAPLDLKRLAYFVAVADELHFGRAAARLYISQPSLSQQIKRLEETLGVELFVRSRGRVTLTPQGHAILPQARRLLMSADQLVEQVRSTSRTTAGTLSLGYYEAAFGEVVPVVLRALRAAAPELSVTLTSFPLSPYALNALVDGRCDAVIMSDTARDIPGLRHVRLALEPMVAALPTDHPLAAQVTVSLAELADQPFAFFSRESDPEAWDEYMSFFDEAGRRPVVEQQGERVQEALLWVGSGQGVSLVPARAATTADPEHVVFRALRDSAPTHETLLAWIEPNANPALEVVAEAAVTAREELRAATAL